MADWYILDYTYLVLYCRHIAVHINKNTRLYMNNDIQQHFEHIWQKLQFLSPGIFSVSMWRQNFKPFANTTISYIIWFTLLRGLCDIYAYLYIRCHVTFHQPLNIQDRSEMKMWAKSWTTAPDILIYIVLPHVLSIQSI